MSPGLFWVVGFKVFLSEGLSLRAALGVFLTNTRGGTPNDGRSLLTPGRNSKTWGDLFGVMIKDVLLSSFKYSALANETVPLQSPFCWLGQSLPQSLGHHCQDLLSQCDGLHVRTD